MLHQITHGARALLCWLALGGLAPAALACTMNETGGNLGSVTTFRVKSGAAITSSANFAAGCSGVVLSALGTPAITATIQPSVTGLTLKNGANAIPYQVYSNAGMSTSYTGGLVVVNLSGTNLLTVLGGSGLNVPIFISTAPGANVPAGTYTDTLQVTWNYQNICEGLLGVLGACVGVSTNASVTRSLLVTLTVSNDCTITAPPVSFGSAPLVSGFPTVSQNISLLCSKNMTYTVGLSAGNNFASGRRQMASGSNRLSYDIYKADNTVWGSLTTARANGPAPSDGSTVQTIPYTARVYQDQATPAAAVYTDSVVVDVSF
ncbi:hypothetical protein RD110_14630 [Rhodoferax koreense]|uniref:Spore coat protein U/FanG domain-containing protein n=1 Tax=Rhodoferax koreensis TaxID=1842727 RepID=A0A1P8JWY9_9BURK|nr:spore coat protein U domain-containing protein [Rhodoferax koreense]APW38274.1 hypothetical protein RD110_14630 [Rhodoferax koreense]